MRSIWSSIASVASYLQTKAICRLPLSKQSPLLGPLRSGGLIWSDPSKGEAIRKNTYGIPHNIITDNGTNSIADEVKLWCSNMGIKLVYASVYHPQTNGQVERANGLIMSGIKPRLVRSLKESNTHWVEELDSVLWGLRTTPNRTTGYTPFLWCMALRQCCLAI